MIEPAAALLAHVDRFVTLDDAGRASVAAAAQPRSVGRRGFLARPGEPAERYFVVQGCLRQVAYREPAPEVTLQFAIEGWWLADEGSFSLGQPSRYGIQALEEAQVLVLGPGEQEALLSRVPALERYFRLVYQRAYGALQTRLELAALMDGPGRYEHFVRSLPDFVPRIPQAILASYLGYTPEYLSKIRSRRGRS